MLDRVTWLLWLPVRVIRVLLALGVWLLLLVAVGAALGVVRW